MHCYLYREPSPVSPWPLSRSYQTRGCLPDSPSLSLTLHCYLWLTIWESKRALAGLSQTKWRAVKVKGPRTAGCLKTGKSKDAQIGKPTDQQAIALSDWAGSFCLHSVILSISLFDSSWCVRWRWRRWAGEECWCTVAQIWGEKGIMKKGSHVRSFTL